MASFKSVANTAGLRLGACVSQARLTDPAFAAMVTENFNLIVPESELTWQATHPSQGTYIFAGADAVMAFARKNGMAVHGHALCWNYSNPGWVTATINQANAQDMLVSHITMVGSRYAGQLESWDVVNEPIGCLGSRPDNLFLGPWLTAMGPEYIDIAFQTIARVDPKATRILNLNIVEQQSASVTIARASTLTLIEALLKRGVPVQAIGIESHLDGSVPLDLGSFYQFLKAILGMGLPIVISEFDVNDTLITPGAITNRDTIVANYYHDFIGNAVEVGKMNRATLWSPTDKNNWMNYVDAPGYKSTDPNFGSHRPGIYDEKMQPKQAYTTFARALRDIGVARA